LDALKREFLCNNIHIFAYLYYINFTCGKTGRILSALFCIFSAAAPTGAAAEAFHHYGIAYYFVVLVMAVMATPATAAATAFAAVVMLLFTA